MKNRTSLFANRPLVRAFDFAAYFLLLAVVAPCSVVRIAATALLAIALLTAIVLLVRASKSRKADGGTTACAGDPLARALVPIGFLVLALVLSPAEGRMHPLLYGFLGLYVVLGIIRLLRLKSE